MENIQRKKKSVTSTIYLQLFTITHMWYIAHTVYKSDNITRNIDT